MPKYGFLSGFCRWKTGDGQFFTGQGGLSSAKGFDEKKRKGAVCGRAGKGSTR